MKFTIRDVLWLTLVVAVLCGWYLTYADWSRLAQAERRRIEAQQRDALLQLSLGWKDRLAAEQSRRAADQARAAQASQGTIEYE